MTKEMKARATEYRVKSISTPEMLECQGFKTIEFGKRTICIGYFYTYGKEGHYTAVYEFTGKGRTCEDECKLIALSDNSFEDEGHACAWGLNLK